jgi:hypothetical protein
MRRWLQRAAENDLPGTKAVALNEWNVLDFIADGIRPTIAGPDDSKVGLMRLQDVAWA